MDPEFEDLIRTSWKELYGNGHDTLLNTLLHEISRHNAAIRLPAQPEGWYKDAVVYALYVDLFNHTFDGLIERLDYLQTLGINCLWLLPILDSPMRDAGFDIKDYKNIRPELLGVAQDTPAEEKVAVFRNFLDEAHRRGIRVIFDVAMNHTSEEHPWFVESRKGPNNPFRDYYIWNKDTNLYKETRLIFKGMVPSNWEKDGDWYFFHRFFEFQPDLNYRNPVVMVEICRVLMFWMAQGVDGFRADAIPYVWKEDGTNCENLPKTHTVLKIWRAVIELVRPNTLLLAEACQPPKEVVKYFGTGDECHAGYHFPLMPQLFKALALQDAEPVKEVLHPSVTPDIPADNQWFMFLRLHDELTLEMVTPEDRAIIHGHYCRDPRWDFRLGEGISARLSELLERDPRRIGLAYSIMLTLPGTPIIYYGDELGKLNDEEFYENYSRETGKEDTRYYVRGRIDWDHFTDELRDPHSLSAQVNRQLKTMLHTRNSTKVFGRGSHHWTDITPDGNPAVNPILAYRRTLNGESVYVVQNLSEGSVTVPAIPGSARNFTDMLSGNSYGTPFTLHAFGYLWLLEI